jgi:hypothetical protein
MNGIERVRLQRMAGVREIVADIDALKMKYGFSRVKVLTPRAEVNLRLGQKSLKPIRVQFEYSSYVSAVMCFTMDYPLSPLTLESLDCVAINPPATTASIATTELEVSLPSINNNKSNKDRDTLLTTKAQEVLREFAQSHAGGDGYAVLFTEYFSQCQWPSDAVTDTVKGQDKTESQTDVIGLLNKEGDDETHEERDVTDLCADTTKMSIFRGDDDKAPSSSSCDPQQDIEAIANTLPASAVAPSPKSLAPLNYKCRKCRNVVFTADDLEPAHMTTTRAAASSSALVRGKPKHNAVKCAALLLNPERVTWVAELANDVAASSSDEVSGSLPCPHCSTKLGSFDWCGAKCACGQWIAPSFKITSSKVDIPLS